MAKKRKAAKRKSTKRRSTKRKAPKRKATRKAKPKRATAKKAKVKKKPARKVKKPKKHVCRAPAGKVRAAENAVRDALNWVAVFDQEYHVPREVTRTLNKNLRKIANLIGKL